MSDKLEQSYDRADEDMREVMTVEEKAREYSAIRIELVKANNTILDLRRQVARGDNVIEQARQLLLWWHKGNTYLSGYLARLTEAMSAYNPEYNERAALSGKE